MFIPLHGCAKTIYGYEFKELHCVDRSVGETVQVTEMGCEVNVKDF